MNNPLFEFSKERRLSVFLEVERTMGLDARSVEKDFWICWTLQQLFRLPEISKHLTFKGGTSLSKGWKLIERFSEDIDLVVDKSVLGFSGNNAPEKATSQKQRKIRLDSLMNASRAWVQDTVQLALSAVISETLKGRDDWSLTIDPDMPDGQCLLFQYPTLFSSNTTAYVRPVVKIELGARSDNWPYEYKDICSYVAEQFPMFDDHICVRVLSVERTFWEKACLLHEESFRPPDKPRNSRMARHYYDLYRLIQAGVSDRAIADIELFKRVVEHRKFFFRYSWVDYNTHQPGSFQLTPKVDQLSDWKMDYQSMLGAMFF